MHLRPLWLPLSALLLVLPFAGCGKTADGFSEVSFALTDAASDELVQFEVDIDNIVLTKLDGTTVSVMPNKTRVDFVDLTSIGELVTAAQLASGTYTSLTLNLDFTNAEVAILGNTGPATVLDANGAPITGPVAVTVDFAPLSRPVVRVNRHHMFVLDLDLEQAVTVDVGANQVRLAPVLSAQIDPANPRPVAITGILTAVDTATHSYTVERRALDNSPIASWTVRTVGVSVFQVDGVVSLGNPGLAAMAGHVGQRVFLQGVLDADERVIVAVASETGAGVFGNGQDWVFGHITGRDTDRGNDAALTVVGRSFDVGTSTRRFNATHTVNVSLASTKVLRRGAGNTLDTDFLNVGQLILAFGDMTGTTLDATAATGVVREIPTRVFGIAAGPASGGRITLDVSRFDLRSESAFNFNVATVVQSDPNAFTVATGSLDTSAIQAGSKLEVFAWINAVGLVGDADCTGLAIVDHTNGARAMLLQWGTGSSTAIDATTSTSITIALPGASIAVVGDGFAPVAVNSSPAPSLVPLTTVGIYRVVVGAGVAVHFTFDGFRRAVETLALTHNVLRIGALGTYDQPTQRFSALTATVVFL